MMVFGIVTTVGHKIVNYSFQSKHMLMKCSPIVMTRKYFRYPHLLKSIEILEIPSDI